MTWGRHAVARLGSIAAGDSRSMAQVADPGVSCCLPLGSAAAAHRENMLPQEAEAGAHARALKTRCRKEQTHGAK